MTFLRQDPFHKNGILEVVWRHLVTRLHKNISQPFSRSFLWAFFLLIAISSVSIGQDQSLQIDSAIERRWTNNAGKSVSGVLTAIGKTTVNVSVGKKDFEIPINSLSDTDQDYIAKQKQNYLSNNKTNVFLPKNLRIVGARGSVEIVDGGKVESSETYDEDFYQETTRTKNVPKGKVIRTGSSSRVSILADSGASLSLQENSEVRIPVPEDNRGKAATSLELLKGSLFLSVDGKRLKERKQEFILNTPTALLAVKGTEFYASTATENGFECGVIEGLISVVQGNQNPSLIETGEKVTATDPTNFQKSKMDVKELQILKNSVPPELSVISPIPDDVTIGPIEVTAVAIPNDLSELPVVLENEKAVDHESSDFEAGKALLHKLDSEEFGWLEIVITRKIINIPKATKGIEVGCTVSGATYLSTSLDSSIYYDDPELLLPTFLQSSGGTTRGSQTVRSQSGKALNFDTLISGDTSNTHYLFDVFTDYDPEEETYILKFSIKADLSKDQENIQFSVSEPKFYSW